jgi:HPt (histidine-containing phosphotransfer) domain-containing protein
MAPPNTARTAQRPGAEGIRNRLRELGVLDDAEFIAQVFEDYTETCEAALAELQGAVHRSEGEACRDLAHRIKGASVNLGAEKMGNLATALEEAGRSGNFGQAPGMLKELATEFERVRRDLEKIRKEL